MPEDLQQSEAAVVRPRPTIIEMSEKFESLAAALVKARAQFTTVERKNTARIPGKDGKMGYSYSYANLADLLNATVEPLARHGLVVIQGLTTAERGASVSVETLLLHETGQWMRNRFTMQSADSRTPQGLGSAVTYARRYALQSMLGVAPEEAADDDGYTSTHTPRNDPPRSQQPPAQRGTGRPAAAAVTTSNGDVAQKRDDGSAGSFSFTTPLIQPYSLVPEKMAKTVRDLITSLKLDETTVCKELTNGTKDNVAKLTFAEGNVLLKVLQERRSGRES
jgi:hypothetical protein